MAANYLDSARRLFTSYKSLGEKAIAQLKDPDLNIQRNEDSNSIAIIVKHLHGNMLSRWTDFLYSDGEKPWRNRDQEFEGVINNKEELLKLWNAGWKCLFDTLNTLKEEDLDKKVFIRHEEQTALDAINRQLAHYSYHIGQIVFLAKELKGGGWISLSIPKNKSQEFNNEKLGK